MSKSRIEKELSLYRKEVFDYQKIKNIKAIYKNEGMGIFFLFLPAFLLALDILIFYKWFL